jgi:uncharacterized membrane protein YoaK (UPF0700 family)
MMFTKDDIEHYFKQLQQLNVVTSVVCVIMLLIAILFVLYKRNDVKLGYAIAFACLSLGIFGFLLPSKIKQTRLCKIELYNYDLHPEYLKQKSVPILQKQQKANVFIMVISLVVITICAFLAKTKFAKIALLQSLFFGIIIMMLVVLAHYIFKGIETNAYLRKVLEFTKNIGG